MITKATLLIAIFAFAAIAQAEGSASLGYGVSETSLVTVTVTPPDDTKWIYIFISKDGVSDHEQFVFANTSVLSRSYHVPLLAGFGDYKISVEASRQAQTPIQAEIVIDTLSVYNADHHHDPYLMATPIIPSDTPAIRQLANTIVQDESDEYERAKLLFGWVAKHILYDNDKNAFIEQNPRIAIPPDALLALSTQKGICQDFSALLIALLRAQNIEARAIRGLGGDPGPSARPHTWVQAYLGSRWVDMDPTFEAAYKIAVANALNKKIVISDANKFKYFDADNAFFASSHQLLAIELE